MLKTRCFYCINEYYPDHSLIYGPDKCPKCGAIQFTSKTEKKDK